MDIEEPLAGVGSPFPVDLGVPGIELRASGLAQATSPTDHLLWALKSNDNSSYVLDLKRAPLPCTNSYLQKIYKKAGKAGEAPLLAAATLEELASAVLGSFPKW